MIFSFLKLCNVISNAEIKIVPKNSLCCKWLVIPTMLTKSLSDTSVYWTIWEKKYWIFQEYHVVSSRGAPGLLANQKCATHTMCVTLDFTHLTKSMSSCPTR